MLRLSPISLCHSLRLLGINLVNIGHGHTFLIGTIISETSTISIWISYWWRCVQWHFKESGTELLNGQWCREVVPVKSLFLQKGCLKAHLVAGGVREGWPWETGHTGDWSHISSCLSEARLGMLPCGSWRNRTTTGRLSESMWPFHHGNLPQQDRWRRFP